MILAQNKISTWCTPSLQVAADAGIATAAEKPAEEAAAAKPVEGATPKEDGPDSIGQSVPVIETVSTEDGPLVRLGPVAHYTTLKKGILRTGFDETSEKVGELSACESVPVFETRRMDDGRLRVRCEGGWASVESSKKSPLLELDAAAQALYVEENA